MTADLLSNVLAPLRIAQELVAGELSREWKLRRTCRPA